MKCKKSGYKKPYLEAVSVWVWRRVIRGVRMVRGDFVAQSGSSCQTVRRTEGRSGSDVLIGG